MFQQHKKPSTMNAHAHSHERPMCVQEATPKTIMRVMGVKGLTLYHLKSHLQKFRLGKQPHKEFNDHSIKDGMRASALELQRNTASSSAMISRSMNEMQMEVQRRLHEQLEVQKHLQLRIEAQGKYMQSILEKACQTLAGENMASGSYKGSIKRTTTSPYSGSGKSPLIWSDDLRLQDLGTAASCLGEDQIQMALNSSTERGGSEIDSLSDIYETKPVISGDHMGPEKKFEGGTNSNKLERPSPRRAPLSDRMSPMIQGRNSPYG
uniref:MYB-CC type transcription factor LHEQLE-containing domain-containing protein n=1 Tax=Cannabis sativa TaxID=3483 RepID=A0A803NRV2_CANSA